MTVRDRLVLALGVLASACGGGTPGAATQGAPAAVERHLPADPPVPWTLDHVPIAVRDLAAAQADFERLGFVFKPGRPHANSIRNAHVKFPGGDEVELITATEPRDALARRYLALLQRGEGAAFVALRTDSVATLVTTLRRTDPDVHADTSGPFVFVDLPRAWGLDDFFVVHVRETVVDSARFLAHSNGAYRLIAAWVALDSGASDVGAFAPEPVAADSAPGGRRGSRVARFPDGRALYLLPRMPADSRVTRIIGITVGVRNIDSTAALLRADLPDPPAVERTARGRRLLIPPARARGVWLEFLEP